MRRTLIFVATLFVLLATATAVQACGSSSTGNLTIVGSGSSS